MGPFLLLLSVLVIIVSSVMNPGTKNQEAKTLPGEMDFKINWRILFDVLDDNHDGIYTVGKCYTHVQLLMDYYNASADLEPGFRGVCQLHDNARKEYFGVNTTKIGMTKSEYVTTHTLYWRNHFQLFKQRFQAFFTSLFLAADSDNDGFINFETFRHFYKEQFGDNESIRKKERKAFDIIDTDGDGAIAEDQFRDIYVKYLADPDKSTKGLQLF